MEEGLPNLGFEVTRLNTYTAVPVHHVDQIVLTQALSAPVVTVASPSAVRSGQMGSIILGEHGSKIKELKKKYVRRCVINIRNAPNFKVKSVVLHTLNRARLNVAIDSFLKTGRVPTLNEGNRMEKIFGFPWSKERPVVLGPRFKDAFQDPNSYLAIEPIFEEFGIIVFKMNLPCITGSCSPAYHSLIKSGQPCPRKHRENDHTVFMPSIADLEAHIAESYKIISALYAPSKSKATEQ
ncbi:unnamed protein product [Camellia sinensis]